MKGALLLQAASPLLPCGDAKRVSMGDGHGRLLSQAANDGGSGSMGVPGRSVSFNLRMPDCSGGEAADRTRPRLVTVGVCAGGDADNGDRGGSAAGVTPPSLHICCWMVCETERERTHTVQMLKPRG